MYFPLLLLVKISVTNKVKVLVIYKHTKLYQERQLQCLLNCEMNYNAFV
jgi:hypothetical protein